MAQVSSQRTWACYFSVLVLEKWPGEFRRPPLPQLCAEMHLGLKPHLHSLFGLINQVSELLLLISHAGLWRQFRGLRVEQNLSRQISGSFLLLLGWGWSSGGEHLPNMQIPAPVL